MGDRSALELAEQSEWAALHRMVSAHPVRAEELDDFGMMPLHWACTDTHVPLRAVKVLADAFPEAAVLRNKGGLVPLHIAVKANAKTEVLRALVAARDDALVEETPAGETPAELAAAVGLARDKVAFLVRAEQQLRASGRAPPRASDRYKSLLALQLQQQQSLADADEDADGDENRAPNCGSRSRRGSVASSADSGWVLTGTSANSLSSAAGMASVGQLRAPLSSAAAAAALPARWRLDSRCNICQVKFSYFKNRHHCRSCGESVCSTHSNHRVLLRHSAFTTPQRVCILCYDEMRETGKPASAVVNMYANPRKDDAAAAGDARRGGRKHPGAAKDPRAHHHPHGRDDPQQRGGPQLRPTRSVLSLTTSAAVGSSSPPQRQQPTMAAANGVYDDDDAAVGSERSRPRAWTEMDATDNFAQMQSQVRELQAHMQELQLAKQRAELQLAVGAREAATARQERLANEYAVAEIRANRMLDISRLPLEDDPNVLRVDDDDDDDDSEDDDDGGSAEAAASVDAALMCNYLGMALFEKGEFASAILEFRKSVGLNASDADVWYNLARALHGAGEFCDAEIAVRRALGMTSRSYALLALLGKILHSKGEDDKSIEVFREALGLMDHGEDSDSDDDVGSATVGW